MVRNFRGLLRLASCWMFAALGMVVAERNPALGAAIALQEPTPSHSSGAFTKEQIIDGVIADNNGWAPGATNVDLNPAIALETVTDGPEGMYEFTFYHSNTIAATDNHTLARFILSATTDNRADFADGVVGGDLTANWTELTPLSAVSLDGSGATFNIIGNEIQVTGTNPATDTYLVKANVPLAGVTGFRVDTISSAVAPLGPGRAPNRNFIITELQVVHVPEPSGVFLVIAGLLLAARLMSRTRRKR